MAIPKEIQDYVNTQIQYYVDESWTYRCMAETHGSDASEDIAFGMILGCLYLGFIQAYRTQFRAPSADDMDEFHKMLRDSTGRIRKALQDANSTR